jgi:hypothetical protein
MSQAKGAGDYRHRAKRPGCARYNWAQGQAKKKIENTHGDWHSHGIVNESREQIQTDIAPGGAAQRFSRE